MSGAPGKTARTVRRLGQALGFSVLLGLVTWLFLRAGAVSPETDYAYMASLRHIQEADVELNAAVVASYANLLQNYDPLRKYLEAIRLEQNNLRQIPACIPPSDRSALVRKLDQLFAEQQRKADDVDRFLRSNSVLRNSEAYFPEAAERLMQTPGLAGNREFEHFVRHLIGARRGVNLDPVGHLASELVRLKALQVPDYGPPTLDNVLRHARVIIERRPEVDGLVERIAQAPTSSLQADVLRTYVAGHEAALGQAAAYRQLLYGVSILLIAYAIYALIRLEYGRRELTKAHADLALRFEAQRRAEAELRLYATVFTHATEGMTITDAESRIVAVNPAFSVLTGYPADEVIGKTPAILNSGRQDAAFYQRMWGDLINLGHWQGEIWNRRKDGAIYPEWLSVVAVPGESGPVGHYIGVFSDISERKQHEAHIHHLAHHDALTGLPNRLLLEDRIGQAILAAKRSKRQMAVIFVDLDRFKNINDTLGHEVGDNLLMQATQRGLALLRDSDTLSRQGGDEFIVVLPDLEHRQDATLVARKLLAALSKPYLLTGHELTVTGSAGIALYPDDGQTVSELLRKADAAMYRAKDEGRNTFRFFSEATNTASLGELLLENDLYGALERGELLVHYQPKVHAGSGQLIGAEALMRWRHREHGMIPPTRFIPLAEKNGMINVFGEWAIDTVCAQQRAWLAAGLSVVPIAVNISALQFAQQDVPAMVSRALAKHGLGPELIELELTESLLMRNAGRAAGILQVLRSMNVLVAIDDFGTGYSSLSYLNQFPVHMVKIDQSFVSQIGEHGETVKLAAAIIAMAHELGLKVIAEGVETEAQARYLLAHGCDQFQGYLYGRPQEAACFGDLLADQSSVDLAG